MPLFEAILLALHALKEPIVWFRRVKSLSRECDGLTHHGGLPNGVTNHARKDSSARQSPARQTRYGGGASLALQAVAARLIICHSEPSWGISNH